MGKVNKKYTRNARFFAKNFHLTPIYPFLYTFSPQVTYKTGTYGTLTPTPTPYCCVNDTDRGKSRGSDEWNRIYIAAQYRRNTGGVAPRYHPPKAPSFNPLAPRHHRPRNPLRHSQRHRRCHHPHRRHHLHRLHASAACRLR